MIEFFIKEKYLEKKHILALYMGVTYPIISFLTAYLLFRNTSFVGIATLFFIVILTLPSINKLFIFEEKLEKKKNLSFFKKHEVIIDFFIYFFIGMFIVFFILSLINPSNVVDSLNLGSKPEVQIQVSSDLPPPPPLPGSDNLTLSIFKNNLFVMFICFLLSLFYGSGAIFLITLNASIFASALAQVIKLKIPTYGFWFTSAFLACNTGIMFFHMIPEVAGYFFAAVAGGVLSKAFQKEKYGSKNFKLILKDSLWMLVIGIIILIIAAIIEVAISKNLFHSTVCIDYYWAILIAIGVIILILVVLEFIRKKR